MHVLWRRGMLSVGEGETGEHHIIIIVGTVWACMGFLSVRSSRQRTPCILHLGMHFVMHAHAHTHTHAKRSERRVMRGRRYMLSILGRMLNRAPVLLMNRDVKTCTADRKGLDCRRCAFVALGISAIFCGRCCRFPRHNLFLSIQIYMLYDIEIEIAVLNLYARLNMHTNKVIYRSQYRASVRVCMPAAPAASLFPHLMIQTCTISLRPYHQLSPLPLSFLLHQQTP